MSSYILLERIEVENANALAGMTYGFPAVTSFLGFTHALSLKFKQQFDIELTGCAIFCHDYHLNTFKEYGITKFIQNRCPPSTLSGKGTDAKSPAPIIEEAKMDMTVSLLLSCDKPLSTNSDDNKSYIKQLKQWVYSSRLSGGSIHRIKAVRILNNNIKTLQQYVLPSYVLLDKSDYLKEYEQYCQENQINKNTFDRWTDFFAFKHQAHINENDEVIWQRIIPPNKKGWLVPLMLGFKGISELYSPEQVANLRDVRYPFRFVEAVYSLGEWKSSHRIGDMESLIWRYDCHDEWYLASQKQENHQIDNQDYVNELFAGLETGIFS